MRDGRLNIPAIVAFVLFVALFGLVFEFMIAAARGEPVDEVAAGGFFTLAGTCVTALAGFWIRDSTPRPPDPPERPRPWPEEDFDGDEPPDRPGWLELRSLRWTPC